MRVAIAYDCSGCKLAKSIISLLHQLGHQVLDIDSLSPEMDSPDLAYCAGREILVRRADRAILICRSGLCTSIAANKMKGLYASPCYDLFEARVSRSKYNTNVLCLSDCWMDNQTAGNIVKEWLETPFQNRSNDSRALKKIEAIEEEQNLSFSTGAKGEAEKIA